MNIIKLSNNNPKIKELKSMFNNNKIKDLIITDDISIIKLALDNKLEIRDFLLIEDNDYHEDTKILIENTLKVAKNKYYISKETFEKLAQKENKIGLIVTVKLNLFTLEEIKKYSYLVIADHLEIPGNLGTIYRTLDSANVEALIIVDAITKANNTKLTSSARGANLLIPTCDETYENVKNWLIENNYTIYLGEPNLGHDYQHYSYSGKIALVIGNERFGINDDWYNNPHEKVYIPMYGANNSLNVGVAASILIYEATMKRKKA